MYINGNNKYTKNTPYIAVLLFINTTYTVYKLLIGTSNQQVGGSSPSGGTVYVAVVRLPLPIYGGNESEP